MRKIKRRIKRTTFWKRWHAESPKVFKKITNICITAGVTASALIVAPISLPAAVIVWLGHIITASVIAGVVSKVTVKDSKALN